MNNKVRSAKNAIFLRHSVVPRSYNTHTHTPSHTYTHIQMRLQKMMTLAIKSDFLNISSTKIKDEV